MGFMSFNKKYYLEKLSTFEGKRLDNKALYEVKQVLKVLDDLVDEGYTNLSDSLEKKYNVITRLRSILSLHSEEPFQMLRTKIPEARYGEDEYEVVNLCCDLEWMANRKKIASQNPFLKEIYLYCDWIGYDSETAYIFLFRDAFLPYMYFYGRKRNSIYPWIINRAFLESVSGKKSIDDEIRKPIYEAMELGITEYSEFKKYCKEHINQTLKNYLLLEQELKKLFNGICEKNIVVIESGYCGTIPMLMTSIDERVDFRLYTTAPFLYGVYKDKIFCKRYENLRHFEKLYSHDVLMNYSSFREGKFYVKLACETNVKDLALGEIFGVIN